MISSLLFALGCVVPTAAPKSIDLYDLMYALEFDADNPQSVAAAWDHCHAVATLQGIVNRDEPNLYLRFVEWDGSHADDFWLKLMLSEDEWLEGCRVNRIATIEELFKKYRRQVNGAVIYDPNVYATSNLASTLAGAEDLVAIRFDPSPDSLYSRLVDRGPLKAQKWLVNEDGSPMFTGKGKIPGTDIASSGSAKCDVYLWLKHHYLDKGKLDACFAGFYIDSYWQKFPLKSRRNHHTLTNHDFTVAKRGWFFDLSVWGDETPVDDPDQPIGTDLETLKALLLSAYHQGGKERMIQVSGFIPWSWKYTQHAGGKHEDVPTEWTLSKILSAYNAYKDADAIALGAMANASFYMHFPLEKEYPQKWVTHEELRERGYLTKDGRVNFDGRDFIIFYVGDYDASAWIYQWMPQIWNSPQRGTLPLMWCISPVLERRVPLQLDWLRRTATPNDYFAAADNGAGYLNPGMLQEPRPISELPSGLDAWARHCRPFYQRWGYSVTGFIIDGFCPGLNEDGLDCYASFSPNGIVPQKVPSAMLHGEMPVLKADRDLTGSPANAAGIVLERVDKRNLPFHWFRAILKGPEWYVDVYNRVRSSNPKIELIDGPTYFELLRIYLKNNPDAAAGRIPVE